MHRAYLGARRTAPALLAAAGLLAGCGPGTSGPAVAAVRPAAVNPSSVVFLAGRGFERDDTVWLAGRELTDVVWVNAGLLATVLPPGIPAGDHAVEVRAQSGRRRSAATLTVLAVTFSAPAPSASAPPPAAPSESPAPTAPPVPLPQPPAAIQLPTRPPVNLSDRNDDDDKRNRGRKGKVDPPEDGRGRGR